MRPQYTLKVHTLETEASVERPSAGAMVRRTADRKAWSPSASPLRHIQPGKQYPLLPRAAQFEKQRDTNSARSRTSLEGGTQILAFITITQKWKPRIIFRVLSQI